MCVEVVQVIEWCIVVDIDDSELKVLCDGCVQYCVVELGEVLLVGGWVLNMVDFSDVYMIFFLLIEQVGLLKIGGEV